MPQLLSQSPGVESEGPHSARAIPVHYRAAIDGLRAIAVVAVFLFHLKREWLPGGFVGVDVFFVISGYLICSILLRDYEEGAFSLAKFYQRRIARLFPAFFAVAFSTVLASSFIYLSQDLASCGANLTAASLSVANLKYMFLTEGYFIVSPDGQPFLHYWSLSVEEQFYLFFPFTLLFLLSKARRKTIWILGLLGLLSLSACILLTRTHPNLAFYLLPTRAWELLAGAVLAIFRVRASFAQSRNGMFSFVGLTLIALSLFAIKEASPFPGYLAVLPVVGTVLIIGKNNEPAGIVESLLSSRPMVAVGKMSYSLYLWHWPIFSLVDYQLYSASPMLRIALKIVLSILLTVASFLWIESPGRIFFNRPNKRRLAFAFLACALVSSVALGTVIRKANYVDATGWNIARGGIAFNSTSKAGSIVLIGDSNGSMYGKTAEEIAQTLGMKLNVISVAGGDPLPYSSGQQPRLWLDSLSFIQRNNPNFIILACNWQSQLYKDQGRLALAVKYLQQNTRQIILITQPPWLPKTASREAIRNGSRPPFREDAGEHAVRLTANALVTSLRSDRVSVIETEPLFTDQTGAIRFADSEGHQFFQDADHLSGFGADLVKPYIIRAITTQHR